MPRIRGMITRMARKKGYGFIAGEDGCEAYFEEKALRGMDMHSLRVGQQVEYDLRFGARAQAVNISPVHLTQKSR